MITNTPSLRWLAGLAVLSLFATSCSYFEIKEQSSSGDDVLAGADDDAADTTSTSNVTDNDGEQPTVVVPARPIDDGTGDVELDPAIWIDVDISLELIAEYEEPIAFESRSGTDDLYVAQKNGVIRRINRRYTSNGTERISTDTRVVLDLSEQVSTGEEQGLLDIEFSLDGRKLYVSYTDLNGDSVVVEYSIDRATRANVETARELLRVPQPNGNHNGGAIEIGDDGFLYIALGDGGGSGDPGGNGQDLSTALGSILRIDPFPVGEQPYGVPDGNPFLEQAGTDERIWLYGVRNPWRFSFDSLTGDLWVADVGQNSFEEVTLLKASEEFGRGANLGWNAYEGFESFGSGVELANHIAPTYAYSHDQGRCSITGGHVYRGETLPLFNGVFFFGDYCTGEVFGLEYTSQGIVVRPLTIQLGREDLVSFGIDELGEMWVVQRSGAVSRVIPTPAEEDAG